MLRYDYIACSAVVSALARKDCFVEPREDRGLRHYYRPDCCSALLCPYRSSLPYYLQKIALHTARSHSFVLHQSSRFRQVKPFRTMLPLTMNAKIRLPANCVQDKDQRWHCKGISLKIPLLSLSFSSSYFLRPLLLFDIAHHACTHSFNHSHCAVQQCGPGGRSR